MTPLSSTHGTPHHHHHHLAATRPSIPGGRRSHEIDIQTIFFSKTVAVSTGVVKRQRTSLAGTMVTITRVVVVVIVVVTLVIIAIAGRIVVVIALLLLLLLRRLEE